MFKRKRAEEEKRRKRTIPVSLWRPGTTTSSKLCSPPGLHLPYLPTSCYTIPVHMPNSPSCRLRFNAPIYQLYQYCPLCCPRRKDTLCPTRPRGTKSTLVLTGGGSREKLGVREKVLTKEWMYQEATLKRIKGPGLGPLLYTIPLHALMLPCIP